MKTKLQMLASFSLGVFIGILSVWAIRATILALLVLAISYGVVKLRTK